MGIKLDEKTWILYGNHIINAEEAAKDYKEWEGACRIDMGDSLSNAPEDELVLRDIFDAPIEILRDAGGGDLVFRAKITGRDGQSKEYERPYTAITLTPVNGTVAAVKPLPSAISFRTQETSPSYVIFDSIKGLDLEMRINYK